MSRKLSIWQIIWIWIRGYAYLEQRKKKGWKEAMSFYLFKCKEHGWQESYNAGRKDRMKLYCEGCTEYHRFG